RRSACPPRPWPCSHTRYPQSAQSGSFLCSRWGVLRASGARTGPPRVKVSAPRPRCQQRGYPRTRLRWTGTALTSSSPLATEAEKKPPTLGAWTAFGESIRGLREEGQWRRSGLGFGRFRLGRSSFGLGSGSGVHPLDVGHRSGVAGAHTELGDAGVATLAILG